MRNNVAEIRAELLRRQKDLERLSTRDGSGDWLERRADLADRSSENVESALTHAQLQTIMELRQQVEKALEAIDDGNYGLCEDCGEPIRPKRLQAVPWALLCVGCAEIAEQTPLSIKNLRRPAADLDQLAH